MHAAVISHECDCDKNKHHDQDDGNQQAQDPAEHREPTASRSGRPRLGRRQRRGRGRARLEVRDSEDVASVARARRHSATIRATPAGPGESMYRRFATMLR